ncbi:MAG: gluconate 2-dehydrogenase subunit 3 family protein [Pseudomonadota bacterium]
MTEAQLKLAESLADIFIPADQVSAAASVANAADFIDEWVSAPYPDQVSDRELILSGLEDIEKRARRRFKASFIDLEINEKTVLVDELTPMFGFLPAYLDTKSFFSRFRYLVVSAFYLSDEGMQDLGYLGNQPIVGPYPGPTEEALAHLQVVLDKLGLKMP